jgi:MFS family permease
MAWTEFRRGWMALLAAFIGNALGAGTLGFYSLGVLAPELHAQFGWGTGAIAGGLLVMTLTTLIVSPFAGLLDRLGVRAVAATSTLLLALSFALFAALPLSLPLYYGLWALVATAGAGTFPMTWSRLINQSFQRRRGLALGISFVGSGLTGFLLKGPLFNVLEQHGLRAGFLLLAILPMGTLIATLLLVPSKPRGPVLAQSVPDAAVIGHALNEALRDWRFWILAVAITGTAFGVGGPLPNMESVLRAAGYKGANAIAIAQIIGLAIVAGRVRGGALLDRVWATAVGFFIIAAD